MTAERLRLVAHLPLAVVLIVNGPAFTVAFAGALRPASTANERTAAPSSSEQPTQRTCRCCKCPKPVPEPADRGETSSRGAPDDPLSPHCPGCHWCCAAKVPACPPANRLVADAVLCTGDCPVESSSAYPFLHSDDLFRPPRA